MWSAAASRASLASLLRPAQVVTPRARFRAGSWASCPVQVSTWGHKQEERQAKIDAVLQDPCPFAEHSVKHVPQLQLLAWLWECILWLPKVAWCRPQLYWSRMSQYTAL
jgi:hypothetical protein